jgi:hypothetical protein
VQQTSKLKQVDPLLHEALQQFANEMISSNVTNVTLRPISDGFKPSSSIGIVKDEFQKQVIFANTFEHEFYIALTNFKQEHR